MALAENVADWKRTLERLELLEFFRSTTLPATIDETLANEKWESILHAFAESEFSPENLDFLRAVRTYETGGTREKGEEIYAAFVASSAAQQVNLPASTQTELAAVFAPEGEDDSLLGADLTQQFQPNVFDTAKEQIRAMVKGDTFVRFIKHAQPAQAALMKAYVDANSVTDDDTDWDAVPTRGRTGAAESVRLDQVDLSAVATVNTAAMKDLAVGAGVPFVQSGRFVLIGNNHDPKYTATIRQQPGSCEGEVTLVEKGGAFSSGKARVEGCNATKEFAAAVAPVSKKKLEFV